VRGSSWHSAFRFYVLMQYMQYITVLYHPLLPCLPAVGLHCYSHRWIGNTTSFPLCNEHARLLVEKLM